MQLFARPKIVIWPKAQSVEIFVDKKDNNSIAFDLNLWEDATEANLQPLEFYLRQNKIQKCSILVPDDIVLTKSFIYDTKIESIEKKDVIGLAESFVPFKIEPDALDYNLVQREDKTIIQSRIYDKLKVDNIRKNLSKLGLVITEMLPVSKSIANVIGGINDQEYFLIYPLNENEYTLMLAKKDSVYLTNNIKGPSLDIQKTINYSNLYFDEITQKIYVPQADIELNGTTKLDKTHFTDAQIAQRSNRPGNTPLPVLGFFLENKEPSADIISTPLANLEVSPPPEKSMNAAKKNVLPIVAVFIFTAALASVIIWFVLNKNSGTDIESPVAENQPQDVPVVEFAPTEPPLSPTPTLAPIDKDMKIQVLNATEINGQAATLKQRLVALGFTSVAVGNSNESVDGNEVRLKPSLSTQSAYFEQNLDFDASYDSGLSESGTYDAVFVIGEDLSEGSSRTTSVTPTPTKKASPTPTSSSDLDE